MKTVSQLLSSIKKNQDEVLSKICKFEKPLPKQFNLYEKYIVRPFLWKGNIRSYYTMRINWHEYLADQLIISMIARKVLSVDSDGVYEIISGIGKGLKFNKGSWNQSLIELPMFDSKAWAESKFAKGTFGKQIKRLDKDFQKYVEEHQALYDEIAEEIEAIRNTAEICLEGNIQRWLNLLERAEIICKEKK